MQPRPMLAIVAASAGWGLAGVGVRAAFQEGAGTVTVLVVRTLVASLAVVAFAAAVRLKVSKEAWREGALIGVLRVGLAPALFIASLNYISAGVEGLVITLIPVVTAVLAHFMLGERLDRARALGLVLGLAGTALLIGGGDTGIAGGAGNTAAGGALALGGVFFGSLSGVLSRRFAPNHDTRDLALPMFAGGGAVAVAAGLMPGAVDLPALSGSVWALLVALGLGSTLLPFVATLYASRHADAARVALTGYLAPVVAIVGGVLLLEERVTAIIVAGGALTLAGVVLVTGGGRRRPVDRPLPLG